MLAKDIRTGFALALPAGLGYIPLGLAFGLLTVHAGLPWWIAPLCSTLIFAGSAEMFMIPLLTAGSGLLTVALTIFFINFRHIFYALSFPWRKTSRGLPRFYSLYALTDEAYAIANAQRDNRWVSASLISMEASLQLFWVSGTLTGALVGQMLPSIPRGLDFALTALFITLLLDAYAAHRHLSPALLAAVSMGIASAAAPGNVLFVSLIIYAIALLALVYMTGRGSTQENIAEKGSDQ